MLKCSKIGAGSQLDSAAISAGGFDPDSLVTQFRLDFPAVPIFDDIGQQITFDLPLFVDGLLIGESGQLLSLSNAVFLFPESQPDIPSAGPALYSFSVFSGNSGDLGRFGVQWEVSICVSPTPVPVPAGVFLLLTGLGCLGFGRRMTRS